MLIEVIENLIKISLEKNRASLFFFFVLFVVGIKSYFSIPKEGMPDVQIPFVIVSTSLHGISVNDSEKLLIKPMESVLRSVEGIKEIRSTATTGRGYVTLEFDHSYDINKALSDTRAKIDDVVVKLPKDADRPKVEEINLGSIPILNVGLIGNVPERTMAMLAKELKDLVKTSPNVLDVNIAGIRDDRVEIIIDPMIIENHQLDLGEVIQLITANNQLISAGDIITPTGKQNVNIIGTISSAEELKKLPIKVIDGVVITLEDIAEIKLTFEDRKSFSRVNGQNCMVLEVSKRSGKNIVDTAKQVREMIESSRQYWPGGIDAIYFRDQSNNIAEMISDLENNVIFATILVTIIMIIFMGKQSALLVSTAVPGAFLISILILKFMGFTLNVVVLFGLILSVGMLVDAAIVVTEYADRKMVIGKNKIESFYSSATHMMAPVISSTLTTIVVFLPLLFWPGMVGKFMQFLPITLISTLTGSIIMALIFVPLLGSIWGKPSVTKQEEIDKIFAIEEGQTENMGPFFKKYHAILEKVLGSPKIFTSSIVGTLFVSIFLYSLFGKGVEFFPSVEPEVVNVIARVNTGNMSIQQKDKEMKNVEEKLYNMKNEDAYVIYSKSSFNNMEQVPDDTIGKIDIELQNWRIRKKAVEIFEDIREKLSEIKGVTEEKKGPQGGDPVQIALTSLDRDKAQNAAKKIIDLISQDSDFVNINTGDKKETIGWNVKIDRELASKFGVNTAMVGNFMKLATNGVHISKYTPNNSNDEISVIARFPENYRNSEHIKNMSINSRFGSVPMEDFVDMKMSKIDSSIDRLNSRSVIYISSGLKQGVLLDDKINELYKKIKDDWDHNVHVEFRGETKDQKETGEFLRDAFIVALMIMFFLLLSQFNSFYHSFVIMSAVFLSTAGVFLGLLITNKTFGIVMCGVGIIALSGIVVNNNILLIDAYNTIKKSCASQKEAIIRASISRIRPILLTAGTTVLGLIPMITGLSIDFIERDITIGSPSSQMWIHLSATIAFGLVFATILTLFFTPCLLILRKEKNLNLVNSE